MRIHNSHPAMLSIFLTVIFGSVSSTHSSPPSEKGGAMSEKYEKSLSPFAPLALPPRLTEHERDAGLTLSPEKQLAFRPVCT